jgi:hypothetical protein
LTDPHKEARPVVNNPTTALAPQLKWLDLGRPAKDERHCIKDAGLKSLKHLKELEYVNLGCNHATEAGLTEFKQPCPR